ncbi:MAG: hypothetical protein ACREOU_13580 [Candidatus Eiseniibacteriota bacterium]
MSDTTAAVRFEDVAAAAGKVDFRRGRLIAAALAILGLGAFAFLLVTGHTKQAWQSYLVNLVFFLGIAQAGIVWAAVARTARGHKWASTLFRYGEAMSSFLPIGYALVLIFLLAGGSTLYPWVAEPIAQKAPWLNWPGFVARNAILMGALVLMSRMLLGMSLRPDLGRAKALVTGKLADLYGRRTKQWKGDAVETDQAHKNLNNLSPWFIVLYCLVYTVWAFDVLMSLDPHWVSTLFGAFIFMSTLYTGLAAMSLLATWTRKPLGLESAVATEQYHTLGKLLFSFAMFWVYSYYSQFLPIWYGNLSEETPYVVLRLKPPFTFWAWTIFFLVFLIPFIGLMNWTTKKNPRLQAIFAIICLTGVWLERNILVLPSIEPTRFDLTLPQLGVMVGFLGAFLLTFLNFASKYPMLSSMGIPSGAPPEWSGGH